MRNRKGLSLIEVLLSMAILSIVALMLLSLFGFSLTNIKKSGDRTEGIYELEEVMNDAINNSSLENSDGIDIKKGVTLYVKFGILEIDFDDGVSIIGRTIKVTDIDEDSRKELVTFVPNE